MLLKSILSTLALTSLVNAIALPVPPPKTPNSLFLLSARDVSPAITSSASRGANPANRNNRNTDEGGDAPSTSDNSCGEACDSSSGEGGSAEPTEPDTSDDNNDGNMVDPAEATPANILQAEQSYVSVLSTKHGHKWLQYLPDPTPEVLLAAQKRPALVTPLPGAETLGSDAQAYLTSVLSRETKIAARVSKAAAEAGDGSGGVGGSEDASAEQGGTGGSGSGGGTSTQQTTGNAGSGSGNTGGAGSMLGTSWLGMGTAAVVGILAGCGIVP